MQDRFEGCVFQRSLGRELSQICTFFMGRHSLRVHMFMLWAWPSTKIFHQTFESPHCFNTKNGDEDNHLLGRYPNHGMLQGGGDSDKGYSPIFTSKPGFCDKPEKVCLSPDTADSVSRLDSEYGHYDFVIDSREAEEGQVEMHRNEGRSNDYCSGTNEAHRPSVLNLPSCTASKASVSLFATRSDQSFKKVSVLHDNVNSFQSFQAGIELVGKKSRVMQWESNNFATRPDLHADGCLEKRLGSFLPRVEDRRSMVAEGKKSAHQLSRASSSQVCPTVFSQTDGKQVLSYSSGQHDSTLLPVEDGRDNLTDHDQDIQTNMGISNQGGDHDYCRIPSWGSEYRSGLGVQEHNRFLRVETVSTNIQEIKSQCGKTSDRPLCVAPIKSNSKVLLMETRPIQCRGGLSSPKVAPESTTLRFPPFCNHKQGSKENQMGKHRHSNFSSPNMAVPNVVQSTTSHVQKEANTFTSEGESLKRPIRNAAPTSQKSNDASSGLDSYRENLMSKGISSKAANLILSARRAGTNANYSSSWNKWVSWCGGKQIDPFRCDVKWVINFLAGLFEEGYEYSSICSYRSAISAFHEKVEGRNVGEHPEISSLVTGIFNERPPQPRYTFIWDVQTVINYIQENMADNSCLSDKDLTFKLTMLLALTSASRTLGLHHLDIRYMGKVADCVVFAYGKLHKSWRKGQKPPQVTFAKFEENESVCVVSTLNCYLDRTQSWRTSDKKNQLLLSYVKPHGPVQSCTIARWIREFLGMTGVDTSIFKAHSTRAASTSKAKSTGLSEQEILKRGVWNGKTTWQRYYRKDINPELKNAICFQEKVLS